MGSSALSLTLLLMSFIHSGLTQVSPRSTLTVTPDNTVFTGERVILTCVIESDHRDWEYMWKKGKTEVSESKINTFTIKQAKTSDAGLYTCEGERRGRPNKSQSNSVSLSVKDLPRSTLTVTPDNTVFTGERVRLMCEIESDHRDWRYEWRKDSVKLQSSERYTVERNTLTIEGSESSDAGQYTCRGHIEGRSVSSQSSSAVSLSVKDLPKTELTVDPKSPVFTGETVDLKCVIESDHRDWRYEWNKDSVKLQSSDRYTVNTDTLTIRAVTTSDEGQYTCRGQRDKRPNSSQESEPINLSVNAASSSLLVTGVVVGSSVCLLFFLSLLLMWRYKKNKDQQRNINQTSVPNQSAQSQLENFPLQSDSDHIYNDGTEVNKRDKDDSDPLRDVTYSEVTVKKKMDKAKAESNNVTYSEVGKRGKKCKSKDINPAGASDLTYAQINIQDKKKTKGKGP
ncbi:obscurin-like isoform X2 [Carassius auratus]|uniref:Obscurin-like isoform X2 n=1 Tax=Carassius auratus TaxID=7957 RepID=A0A6P6PBB1_CARAU|nr:obscurin-like isoform X2 [Carassius auratus]